MREGQGAATGLGTILPAQRDALVRLCAHLTGHPEVAEDLAQETLYEAWRHAHRLYDPGGRDRWLAAIARNVCLRWTHRYGREQEHRAPRPKDIHGTPLSDTDIETQAADFDVEIELERGELATLLDRALALLPEPTRAALIERYIHESPLAEVAARLGVSEDAVTKRIERGKLTLRTLLTTDPALRPGTAAYAAADAGAREWQETRIWCTRCGERRLHGRFVSGGDSATFRLRCPRCFTGMGIPYTDLHGPALARAVPRVTKRPFPARITGCTTSTCAPSPIEGCRAPTAGARGSCTRPYPPTTRCRWGYAARTASASTVRGARRRAALPSRGSPWGGRRCESSGARTRACARCRRARSRARGAPRS